MLSATTTIVLVVSQLGAVLACLDSRDLTMAIRVNFAEVGTRWHIELEWLSIAESHAMTRLTIFP